MRLAEWRGLGHGYRMPAAATLDHLRTETRYHQCVADADRLAFVERTPGLDGYRDYLIRAYGFEVPLESALSAAPDLRDVVSDLRANAKDVTRELVDLGFLPQDLLTIAHCKIVPLRSLAQACGWLYVAWRNRGAHEMLRMIVARRFPEQLRWEPALEQHTTLAQWNELGRLLDEIAAVDGIDEMIDGAVSAYDCQHFWYQADAPSGTAFATAMREAEQRLRQMPRTMRRPSESD